VTERRAACQLARVSEPERSACRWPVLKLPVIFAVFDESPDVFAVLVVAGDLNGCSRQIEVVGVGLPDGRIDDRGRVAFRVVQSGACASGPGRRDGIPVRSW
jgi:hypothetical protein